MRVSRIVIPLVAIFAVASISGPPASAVSHTVVAGPAATTPQVGFASSAWGTSVTAVDATIRSGLTSFSGISCTMVTGLSSTNTLASVTLPVVGQTGTLTSKVTTSGSGTTRSTDSTATVQAVNLLGGAVVANAITVSANAKDVAGVSSTTGSTSFVGLKVLGQTIAASVAPNTQIAINAGGQRVGTVTLNLQSRSNTNGLNAISVRGISISLLAGNPYGLPAATSIFIGGANSLVTNPRVGIAGGSGWGVSATALNGTVVMGRQPNVGVACFGGTSTGSLATLTRAPLLETGTTQVTTWSTSTPTTGTARVVTSVAAPRILAGLISADTIVAEAHAARTVNDTVSTGDRSKFVGLKVVGLPLITDSIAPNTTIQVPGLGAVTFHKVTKTAKGIEIVMLEIKLSSSIAGLPTGTVVQVAGANSTVTL